MNFTLFDLLVIIGISQGLFTGFLLLSNKQNFQRNGLLAATLFTFILLSFKILLHTIGLWEMHTFRYFPLGIDLVIQPLVYLYIRSTVDLKFRIDWRQTLHFIPSLIFMIYAIVVYLETQTGSSIAEQDAMANSLLFNEIKLFEDILSVISAWFYCTLSYIMLKNYRRWINDNSADMSYPTYTWLRNILVLFSVLFLILTLNLMLDRVGFGMNNFYHWQLFYLCMAIAIYYMGIQGYRQQSLPPVVTPATPAATLDEQTIASARRKILEALENDKVYRDPEISIQRLAAKVGLPVNTVSHTINTALRKNFRNLVNEYRMAEVKEKLSDPQFRRLSLLGIALECGFNSEASFYRVFKRSTGMSPKEFIDGQSGK